MPGKLLSSLLPFRPSRQNLEKHVLEILRECDGLANLDEKCFTDIPKARSTIFTGLALMSGRKRFLLSYFFFLVL